MSSSNNPLRYYAAIVIGDTVTQLVNKALEGMPPEKIVKSCISCDHFKEDVEGCKISNMQRPPARVIAFGCAKWDSLDDDIPF